MYLGIGTSEICPYLSLAPVSELESCLSLSHCSLVSPDLSLVSLDLSLVSPDLRLVSPDLSRSPTEILFIVIEKHCAIFRCLVPESKQRKDQKY